MSFDLTVGPLMGLSDYSDHLTQPVAGVLGVEFAKAPFTYNIGLSGGGQRVLKTFNKDDEIFPEDSEPNILNAFLHVGYQLIDSRKWKVIPRAGVHFSSLRYPVKEDIDSGSSTFSFTLATTIDYKLKSWNRTSNTHMLFSEIGLRFGAYYYPMNVGELNMSHILLTAGLSWTFGPINARYPE